MNEQVVSLKERGGRIDTQKTQILKGGPEVKQPMVRKSETSLP